jgi:tRNA uridine 5-carboxymethylaminomethyl modification enzyme
VPPEWSLRVLGGPLTRDQSGFELLRRPGTRHAQIVELAGMPPWGSADERLPSQVELQVEVRAKYAGYIDRQREEVERLRRNEETTLPDSLDYASLAGLSVEVRQRLAEVRPATIGQAARISGVTPAAISILLVHLKKVSLRTHGRVA